MSEFFDDLGVVVQKLRFTLHDWAHVLNELDARPGRCVYVTGVGKSGIAAEFLAASLRAHALHAQFLHPTEALHGDLANYDEDRCSLIIISASGSTSELHRLLERLPSGRASVGILGERGTLAQYCNATLITGAATASDSVTSHVPSVSFVAAVAISAELARQLAEVEGVTVADRELCHPAGNVARVRRS